MKRAGLLLLLLSCGPKLDTKAAKPAPSVEGVDLEGNTYRLADHVGKVVLVNHFGTWCPPCVREIPHLVRLHAELAPRGFEVVAIDHNDTLLAAKSFAEKHAVRFPIVFLPPGKNPFRVRGLPTNVLVDRKGLVRMRSQGFRGGDEEKLRVAVETLLAEP